ncbi:uncharacterized protein BDW43DRAFT_295519 [Aspergillus alliaceus]|uniref:uncharacterized protein n=1 Tax=Petromyces alliaceus TaxID=209559 RepID=UPI0012A76F65|nr:uncharacterized protein BDW43DRAFT_295519 [Aspergillus alliaceus]KAB8226867.1 hypothetical protein BDW43DRAFT_295519 [Aspergillus alliaceus]
MPATGRVLARDVLQNLQSSNWIPALIISQDIILTEKSASNTRPLLDSCDLQDSVILTTLGRCLQSSVPGWPKKRPFHD